MATGTLAITFSQKNTDRRSVSSLSSSTSSAQDTPQLPPLPIPIQTAIYDKDTGVELQSSLLVLNQHEQTFYFNNVSASSVVISPLQSFSAPVKLAYPQQTEADLLFLLKHDTDAFNRWECQQRVSSHVILEMTALGDAATIRQAELPQHFVDAFKQALLSIKVTYIS